jgi:nicotinamide-nucleotide amidase
MAWGGDRGPVVELTTPARRVIPWKKRNDRIASGGAIRIAIAATDRVAFRRSRVSGGREWVRLDAVELALDGLRRFPHGLPVVGRIGVEKS